MRGPSAAYCSAGHWDSPRGVWSVCLKDDLMADPRVAEWVDLTVDKKVL